MNQDDKHLAEALRRTAPEEASAPAFDDVFGRAEAQYERSQRRRFAGVAAAVASVAVVALVVTFVSTEDTVVVPEPVQLAGLLDTTSWVAPSDVLLPEHEFDIFEELPEPMKSTESAEGALL